MNNLKLVTTKNFEEAIPCDFWADINDEYFLTREQIGRALGYSNPTNAIKNIHLKHKERLDKFSTWLTLSSIEGDRHVERERILYSRKGVMEICRWSRQPKADEFMDWCWDVIDNLIAQKLKETANANNRINKNIYQRLSCIETALSTLVPKTTYSDWKNKVARTIRYIAIKTKKNTNDGIKSIYAEIYRTMREEYDTPVDKYKQQYIEKNDITYNPYAIDIVDNTPELKTVFEIILKGLCKEAEKIEIHREEGKAM